MLPDYFYNTLSSKYHSKMNSRNIRTCAAEISQKDKDYYQ